MNRKLFTLMALGLLTAGSAFAQKAELADGTALDGSKWYFLGTKGGEPNASTGEVSDRVFVGGQKLTVGTNTYTVLNDSYLKEGTAEVAQLSADGTENNDYDAYLWKVTASAPVNGTYYYQLKNKATGATLVFNEDDGKTGTGDKHGLSSLTWAMGGTDGKYKAGHTANIGTKGAAVLNVTNSAVGYETGTPLYLYTVNPKDADVESAASPLSAVFALSFPDAKPQPETNIFDQKIRAFSIDDDDIAPEGTYLATSWPSSGRIDSYTEFKASKFIAVSPTENFEINGLSRADGAGFSFVEVSGKDLKSVSEKDQVNISNANFHIYYADPVNKAGQITLELPAVYVKKDASKDEHKAAKVYVNAVTSAKVTYVTTQKSEEVAKLTLSESNKVTAEDILKEDAPAVFNIQFISSKSDVSAEGSSEYGKYLGLRQIDNSGDAYALFAEAEAYLNLKAAQNQWVITKVDGTDITFTSRENSDVEFTVTLTKTEKDGEYELAGVNSDKFTWGYRSDDGYEANDTGKDFSDDLKVKLIPATIDEKAGFADYTKLELSQTAKIKFVVPTETFGLVTWYATVDNTGELDWTTKAYEATKWTITKNTAAADSLKNTLSYAYQRTLDGKVVAKTDKLDDKAIATYTIQDEDGKYLTYDANYKVSNTKQNIVIKQNVNGTVSLVMSTAGRDYEDVFDESAEALVLDITTDPSEPAIGKDYALLPNLTGANILPIIEIIPATPSLEAVSRHASFQSVNGGFLAVGSDNQAVVAAAVDEAANLTFWLDTADVEEVTPSFFISQSPSVLKADAARNFLWNPTDSAMYFNDKTASYVENAAYYHKNDPDTEILKAMFKPATLINKDSLTTTVNGKTVGVTPANGLENYKFQIVLADEDVEDEYVIRSAADASYLTSKNGKLVLDDDITEALVVTLGEGDATANEAIAAEGVQVIGGQGVVTVQGAAGKVITVANILGQTIANQVAVSDNVTIAAPAGVVVVAVEGDATKVVVK